MKKVIVLFCFSILVAIFLGNAQTTEQKPKNAEITEFQFFLGFINEKNNTLMLDDFKALSKNSLLLNTDLSLFSRYSDMSIHTKPTFSTTIGIQFSDKEKTKYKPSPLLRLGFSYTPGNMLTGTYSHSIYTPYDTLISSQTGNKIFVDSVTTYRYGMEYSYDQLRFDGSVIFRTDPEKRWSVYGGGGISFGLSLNANSRLSYTIEKYTEQQNSGGMWFSNFPYPYYSKEELIRNKINYGFSVYFPLGVDVCLGKKREFWKLMHLFWEVRPGVNFDYFPETGLYTRIHVPQGIGIKVKW